LQRNSTLKLAIVDLDPKKMALTSKLVMIIRIDW